MNCRESRLKINQQQLSEFFQSLNYRAIIHGLVYWFLYLALVGTALVVIMWLITSDFSRLSERLKIVVSENEENFFFIAGIFATYNAAKVTAKNSKEYKLKMVMVVVVVICVAEIIFGFGQSFLHYIKFIIAMCFAGFFGALFAKK